MALSGVLLLGNIISVILLLRSNLQLEGFLDCLEETSPLGYSSKFFGRGHWLTMLCSLTFKVDVCDSPGKIARTAFNSRSDLERSDVEQCRYISGGYSLRDGCFSSPRCSTCNRPSMLHLYLARCKMLIHPKLLSFFIPVIILQHLKSHSPLRCFPPCH
jgi:hypothetical protein